MARNDYGIGIDNPATVRAVSLDEAKKQLELTGTTHHDTFLSALIVAAEEKFRAETSFQFGSQQETLYLKRFPCGNDPIYIPIVPCQSIESVSYLDPEGSSQTVDPSEYETLLNFDPARLEPANSWPTAIADRGEAVSVKYTVGSADSASFPHSARQAVLILIAIMFAERAGDPPNKLTNRLGDLSSLYVSLRDSFKNGSEFFEFGT